MRISFWRSRQHTPPPAAPPEQPDALEQQLAPVRERFRARLREDLRQLAGYQGRLVPPAPELASLVHRLAGTAGMLGFDEISAKAGALNDRFIEEAPPADVLEASFRELLALIERAISAKSS